MKHFLLWAKTLTVLVLYRQSQLQAHKHSDSLMLKKHSLALVLPNLWFLQSSCPSSRMVPKPWWGGDTLYCSLLPFISLFPYLSPPLRDLLPHAKHCFLPRGAIKPKVTEERIIKAIISLWEEIGVVFLLDGIIPCVWERTKELLVGRRGQRIHFTILLKWALSVNHLLGLKILQRRNGRKWLNSWGRSRGKVGTPHTLRYTLNLGNHYLHRNLIIKHPSALTLLPVLVWLLDWLFIGLWHSRVDFSLKKQYTGLIWNMICIS